MDNGGVRRNHNLFLSVACDKIADDCTAGFFFRQSEHIICW
jgi:hypothetical protein